jgi:hypothetical protein
MDGPTDRQTNQNRIGQNIFLCSYLIKFFSEGEGAHIFDQIFFFYPYFLRELDSQDMIHRYSLDYFLNAPTPKLAFSRRFHWNNRNFGVNSMGTIALQNLEDIRRYGLGIMKKI